MVQSSFLKEDNSPTKDIAKLKENPKSEAKQNRKKSLIESELEDNPEAEKYIQDIFEKMKKTEEGGKIINTITNSKNVVLGNITDIQGNINIGDRTTNKNQTHSGSGDNVAGNKIIND